jgi:mono/diheme cytochrome c family protein
MKIWKRLLLLLGGLVTIILFVLTGLYVIAESRFNKTYVISAKPITISTSAESVAIGRHWAEVHCQSCHGEDLGGGPFFEDPALGYVDAPNLTPGKGGIGNAYTDADWVHAIRHGVLPNGKSVFLMPSNDFYFANDQALAGMIAYMKTLPPIDRETRPRSLTPLAKVLFQLGVLGDLLRAETIPHTVRPPAPPEEVTVEYGEYLTNAHGCKACHGSNLAGGQPPEPGAPYAPNLTLGGELIGWDEDDFFTAMREGLTPGGRQLSPAMPWKGLGKLTDEDLKAIWLYLQAQPKLLSNKP